MHGLILSALRQLFGPEIAPLVFTLSFGITVGVIGWWLLTVAFISLVRYARWIWAHLP